MMSRGNVPRFALVPLRRWPPLPEHSALFAAGAQRSEAVSDSDRDAGSPFLRQPDTTQLVQCFREQLIGQLQPFDILDHALDREEQLVDPGREFGGEPPLVVTDREMNRRLPGDQLTDLRDDSSCRTLASSVALMMKSVSNGSSSTWISCMPNHLPISLNMFFR